LLAPSVAIVETAAGEAQTRALGAKRRGRLRFLGRLRAFGRMPASAFGFVESAGLGYAAKLIGRSLFMRPAASPDRWGLRGAEYGQVRPRLAIPGADTIESRAALAEKILRAMSFGGRFARLVLLVGHGSSSANNAHAASLDCGACCGQTGAANARALAALLNEPAVRSALARRGIVVPQTTRFLAALHDTTTDDVELFDADDATPTHAEDLDRVRIALRAAGQRARAERAPALGLAHLVEQPGALHRAVRRRAGNWAETRPEWGLAGNAAFIAAPRGRTRGVDLGGRVFLHEYDWRLDADGSVLELIMTAPMVVAHWINMQYNASVTDNVRYGSGNKLLHNVVGGRIGVFEGNGGDLRIGLPLQSVHDGKEWRHTPQRLSVYIEAPRGRVEAVVAKHPVVRQLVGNRWIFLFAIDPASGRIDPVHAPVHRADAEEAAGSRAIG
jgi:uncharacterized protein YbcC (UPF0753/DUF2309 family)